MVERESVDGSKQQQTTVGTYSDNPQVTSATPGHSVDAFRGYI